MSETYPQNITQLIGMCHPLIEEVYDTGKQSDSN